MTTGRLTTRGAALGANQCFNGCKVTRSTGDASQFSVAFPDAPTVDPVVVSGGSATTWTATGDTCTGEKVVSSEAAYSASGANYAKVEPDGCGTVNGARFCASDLPTATNCATGSDGSRVCGSTASTPPVPIKPGTGTGAVLPSPGNPSGTPAVPAQPADPNATIGTTDAAGNTTTHNYYNTTTVNNQGGDGTGSTGGTQSGNGFATCGGPGQPACAVDLDETGTPTDQSLAEAIGYDHEARGTELNELATTSPLNGINTAGVTNAVALPSGTCTSISPSFTWRGNTYAYAFPGTKGCVMIEMIKTVLDWLIGSITVLWCVRRFMEG